MKIAPENIQVGDRITVSGTVGGVYPDGDVAITLDGGDGYRRYLSPTELARAEITRPPRPLAVGDRVVDRSIASRVVWRIMHIDEDYAWLKRETEAGARRLVSPIKHLTRIRETADDAD